MLQAQGHSEGDGFLVGAVPERGSKKLVCGLQWPLKTPGVELLRTHCPTVLPAKVRSGDLTR